MNHWREAAVRGSAKVREAGVTSPSHCQLLDPSAEALCLLSEGGLEPTFLTSKCATSQTPPSGVGLCCQIMWLCKEALLLPPKRRLRKALRSILSRYAESQSSSKSFILPLEQLLQHPALQSRPPVETWKLFISFNPVENPLCSFTEVRSAEVNLGLIHMLEGRWKVSSHDLTSYPGGWLFPNVEES